MEKHVAETLKELGIPANLDGYHYIKTAVAKLLKTGARNCAYCTLYRQIADEYGSTYTRVERAMRHAIEVGATRGNHKLWSSIFRYSISSAKGIPTISEFVATLTEYCVLYRDEQKAGRK